MAQFILKINLGNEAMMTGSDIARALRDIAEDIEDQDQMSGTGNNIMDLNGNSVGKWSTTN
jgi:hypothetical protein